MFRWYVEFCDYVIVVECFVGYCVDECDVFGYELCEIFVVGWYDYVYFVLFGFVCECVDYVVGFYVFDY